MESRHLSWERFEALIAAGPPALEVIAGTPRVELFTDPGGGRIGLRIHTSGAELPPSPLVEIEVVTRDFGVGPLVEVATSNRPLYRDFYAFACSLADRLQIDGFDTPRAIEAALGSWSALLREIVLLTPEKQTGLLGELWLLERIAGISGWEVAASSWKDKGSEEHDFSLEAADIEVKTTQLERRKHMIGSLTQLLPVPGRPLYLLSLQFTEAGAGEGRTLSERVAGTLASAGSHSATTAGRLRARLGTLGWRPEHAPHYRRRYHLRSPAVLIPIDDSCPALVPELLAPLGPSRVGRIEQVSYRIDVTGLGHEDGSPGFQAVLPNGSPP